MVWVGGKPCLVVCFRDAGDENTGRKARLTVPPKLKAGEQLKRAESNYVDKRNCMEWGVGDRSRFSESSGEPEGQHPPVPRALSAVLTVCCTSSISETQFVRELEVGRGSEVLSHDQITISRQFVIECRKVGHWWKSVIWNKDYYKNVDFSIRIKFDLQA